MSEVDASPKVSMLRHRSASGVQSLKFKTLSKHDLTEYDEVSGSKFSQKTFEDLQVEAEKDTLASRGSLLGDLLDVSGLLTDAASAIVDDSFNRCFTSLNPDPWNWNLYLFPLWCCGVLIRYLLLFPIRLLCLILSLLLFFIAFGTVKLLLKHSPRQRELWERRLVSLQTQAFVASWTGVVRYHGPRPLPRANHVWVANHTSMIDYIILCACSPFAVIMQLHPGWVGFFQTTVLSSLGCLWFNRSEVKDRQLVHQRMKAHVADGSRTPLLIFPEGTCVNNNYCVMFKRGAFDLGATVCPIAIKYNKIFVDAFWNSRRQSFTAHMLKLMCSWAVVCDVYFLEPTGIREGESSQQFAERVQRDIAARANLKIVPWDGYLKYYNLAEKHPDLVARRQRLYADLLLNSLQAARERCQGGGEHTPRSAARPTLDFSLNAQSTD